jgi:hypothetical protein
MNIIFGESVKLVPDTFTVLELDTFYIAEQDKEVKVYCVLEKVPLEEFSTLEQYKDVHDKLIEQYRKRNWNYCKNAIETLTGHWAGELDSFYQDLGQRIDELVKSPPTDAWNGTISAKSA